MRSLSTSAELDVSRRLLAGLVQQFELEDPAMGIVGIIPVIGGVFIHPLTREPIPYLRVYGARAGFVKIAEPRFLRSLPLVPLAGVVNPTQFCALTVKLLNGKLKELAHVRHYLASMGIRLELEHDVLRLCGSFLLRGLDVTLTVSPPQTVTVIALSGHALAGVTAPQERTLSLTGEPTADREALARLVDAIEERRYAALTPTDEAFVADRWLENDSEAAAPPPETSLEEESRRPLKPVFADARTSEIVELTDALDQVATEESTAALLSPAREHRYASIPVREIFEKIGTEARLAARGGRLQVELTLKVIQGVFSFHLEQHGPKQFAGCIVNQQGRSYPVEFDLDDILDIKEVFDRIVLGKTSS